MTVNLTQSLQDGVDFRRRIEEESGQTLSDCYQCGKCTAGCPVAFAADVAPHQVVRFLQLGLRDEALAAQTIWLCATCSTCTTRCPRNVDLAKIMDCLRIAALRHGKDKNSRQVALFNNVFLESVCKYGRAYELGLAMALNLKRGTPLKDADLGLGMFKRRKLRITPSRIRATGEIAAIFRHAGEMKDGK